MTNIPRSIQVLLAALGLTFGTQLLFFVSFLFMFGPDISEKLWGPLISIPIFAIYLFVANRYLRTAKTDKVRVD